jgi:hypothetical protein
MPVVIGTIVYVITNTTLWFIGVWLRDRIVAYMCSVSVILRVQFLYVG